MPAPHSTLHGTVVRRWSRVVRLRSGLSPDGGDCRSSVQEHGQRGNHQRHPGGHRGAEGQPPARQDQRSSRHEPAKLERDRIASRRALPLCLLRPFCRCPLVALNVEPLWWRRRWLGSQHKQLSRKAHARAPSEGSFLFGSNQKVITDYKSDEDDDDDSDDDGTCTKPTTQLFMSARVV